MKKWDNILEYFDILEWIKAQNIQVCFSFQLWKDWYGTSAYLTKYCSKFTIKYLGSPQKLKHGLETWNTYKCMCFGLTL